MNLEDRTRIPGLVETIYRRPRLLNHLTDLVSNQHRLVTIWAPDGYGKSTLLVDFAAAINLPVCWCTLQPTDRDPTSFFTLLVYSLTHRFIQLNWADLLAAIKRVYALTEQI